MKKKGRGSVFKRSRALFGCKGGIEYGCVLYVRGKESICVRLKVLHPLIDMILRAGKAEGNGALPNGFAGLLHGRGQIAAGICSQLRLHVRPGLF